jgi:membrane fusion protein (multidrug efflux system)
LAFLRTKDALDRDPVIGARPLLAAALAVGGAWTVWLVFGRVDLTESTDVVRLEAGASIHPVDAAAGGRVTAVHARLGQPVEAGDPLLELDAEETAAELREARGRLAHQRQRLSFARQELAAEESLAPQDIRSAESALGEARARADEAQAELALAEKELEYAVRLRETGLVSDVDVVRRRSEVERRRAVLRAAREAVARLEADRGARGGRARGRREHLKEEVSAAAEEVGALETRVSALERQVGERTVRAPVAGRIGRLAPLRPGTVIAAGQRVADVVPPGGVTAVAQFPLGSLGRLRPGQPGRLRLAAYPWTAFGALRTRVRSVGDEPHEGRVRVELDVEEPVPDGIALAHGLVGSLEVEVARVRPLALALRAAGGPTPVAPR